MKAGAIFVLLALAVLGMGFVDYANRLLTANENRKLTAENVILKNRLGIAADKLSFFGAGIERVQSLADKFKQITNVDYGSLALNPASGNSQKKSKAVAMRGTDSDFDREPSSEVMVQQPIVSEETTDTDGDSWEFATHQDAITDYALLSNRIDREAKESQLQEQGLMQLLDKVLTRQNLLAATPSIKPALGRYTSHFGYRVDPFTGRSSLHPGLDIAAPFGTPVHATADGIVAFAGKDGGYGKLVSIDNGYGVTTRFGHNSQIFVHQGQKVHRGDVISAMGSTGRSTGPHVHYEVRLHGLPVDPVNYILNY
jgi:murein DD-endopeptidase MepM/ murein hydrolase activator NlpD